MWLLKGDAADDQDIKAPMHEPWSKWVEMQQQMMVAVKGAQTAPKRLYNIVPPWFSFLL